LWERISARFSRESLAPFGAVLGKKSEIRSQRPLA
jgi:hypothetical protein